MVEVEHYQAISIELESSKNELFPHTGSFKTRTNEIQGFNILSFLASFT